MRRLEYSSQSHAEADDNSLRALGHHLQRKDRQIAASDKFTQSAINTFAAIKNNSAEEIAGYTYDYNSDMQLGGNKESYNEKMNELESEKIINNSNKVLSKRERILRNFNERQKNLETELTD